MSRLRARERGAPAPAPPDGPSPRRANGTGAAEEVERLIARALAGVSGSRIAVAAIPAQMDAFRLLRSAAEPEAVFWRDREGHGLTAVGVAATLTGHGPGRFREVVTAAEAFPLPTATLHPDGPAPPRPRWIGGFSFAEGAADHGPWRTFGDARFVLPRLTLITGGETDWLMVALDAGWVAENGGPAGVAARIAALEGGAGPSVARAAVPAIEWGERWEPAWEGRVRAALASIRAGVADKLVLARRSTGRITGDDAPELLRRLESAEGSYRFGFCFGGSLFLGATPERLVARRGCSIRTEALAGTAGANTAGDRPLARRPKDLHEHQVVVETIRSSLAPLCRRLEHDPAPRLRDAGPVHHLATEFEGELAEDTHLLRVAEALHPTPAVGGSPTDAALRWLAEHEPDSRGWYAAPVGWFDDAGDGELAVALRCGLIHDGVIHLYAGAGIVEGSDPRAEHEETELKMRALPQALGLDR